MITAADIIAKRKRIWSERHDIDYDRRLVKAAAIKILETPSLVREIRERPHLLIEIAFCIVDKKRDTVPFFFNDVQRDFIDKLEKYGTSKPFFVLKGRQQGFTSVITAIQLAHSLTRKNFAGFTIADKADNTATIFNDKARVVYERLPEELKPSEKFNSRNELFFDKLNSSWRIATASNQVGRSRTLNFVHFSEVAHYKCELKLLQAGIGEAITSDAIQVYETTANGFNQAKELWDSGSCHNLFYEWWRSPEYRSTEYEYLETTNSWLIQRMKVLENLGCDKEQITWYAKKWVKYLDKSLIRQEYPISPDEAFVSSGESVFDKDSINNQLALCLRKPGGRIGYFEYKKEAVPIAGAWGNVSEVEWKIRDIEFVEDVNGYITIHEDPLVRRDSHGEVTQLAPYALGGDTAGDGSDYFTAKVQCCLNDKTVATLRKQHIDEDLYAEQLYCLGTYYHEALIAVEINYSRHPTRLLSNKYSYPNMYMRKRLDGISDRTVLEYGFETTPKTKPMIIGELVKLVRTHPECECDVETLREMTTFVKMDNGSTGAISGCHDDLVMAKAIANFISAEVEPRWIPAKTSDDDYINDNFNYSGAIDNAPFINWEDY